MRGERKPFLMDKSSENFCRVLFADQYRFICVDEIVNCWAFSEAETYTVKNIYRFPVFFLPNLSETGKALC
jgi:hypothetical protein